MIVGSVNYILWHNQFLGLDSKYTMVFVVLPMIIGFFAYYTKNKLFNKSVFNTKPSGLKDSILSTLFLILIGSFFAFISMVTIANVIFKLAMDVAANDKPLINKTYVVKSTVRNDVGRRTHFFSHIYYLDEANRIKCFDVSVNAVTSSYEKQKIIFQCKEGFWGYYKIVDYSIE